MGKRKIIIFLILMVFAIGVFLFWLSLQNKAITLSGNNNIQPAPVSVDISAELTKPNDQNQNNIASFRPPLDRASERVTKKPFGIFITPKTSPIQPERFKGYHTGADFEIFPEELDVDVSVHAVCSGKLLLKKYATGYGGVAVQSCMLDKNPITVIYGHLKLASIILSSGDSLSAGDTIGILGRAYSAETNGERKHLHLGFHQGTGINILGYVQNKNDLSGWIDPCLYACQ